MQLQKPCSICDFFTCFRSYKNKSKVGLVTQDGRDWFPKEYLEFDERPQRTNSVDEISGFLRNIVLPQNVIREENTPHNVSEYQSESINESQGDYNENLEEGKSLLEDFNSRRPPHGPLFLRDSNSMGSEAIEEQKQGSEGSSANRPHLPPVNSVHSSSHRSVHVQEQREPEVVQNVSSNNSKSVSSVKISENGENKSVQKPSEVNSFHQRSLEHFGESEPKLEDISEIHYNPNRSQDMLHNEVHKSLEKPKVSPTLKDEFYKLPAPSDTFEKLKRHHRRQDTDLDKNEENTQFVDAISPFNDVRKGIEINNNQVAKQGIRTFQNNIDSNFSRSAENFGGGNGYKMTKMEFEKTNTPRSRGKMVRCLYF